MIDASLKNEIKQNILNDMNNENLFTEENINKFIDEKIKQSFYDKEPLNIREKISLRKIIYNSLKKYDILTELLDDKSVKEIMINSYDEIFIDKNGKYTRWDKKFDSKEQLENIIQKIVGKINRIVNVSSPIADARLEDGSRVHIVLPPIAPCLVVLANFATTTSSANSSFNALFICLLIVL